MTEASAPVAEASAPQSREAKMAEILSSLDKRISDIDAEIEKEFKAKNYGALTQLSANADALRAQRVDLSSGLDRDKYLDNARALLTGAPEGRFIAMAIFEGGVCVSFERRASVETPARAQSQSTETKARAATSESIKANFKSAGVSGDATRHAPEGWRSSWSYKGRTWSVQSLGSGSYQFESGTDKIAGVGNSVIKQITGHSPNVYYELSLPDVGLKFDTSNPPKGWTKS